MAPHLKIHLLVVLAKLDYFLFRLNMYLLVPRNPLYRPHLLRSFLKRVGQEELAQLKRFLNNYEAEIFRKIHQHQLRFPVLAHLG